MCMLLVTVGRFQAFTDSPMCSNNDVYVAFILLLEFIFVMKKSNNNTCYEYTTKENNSENEYKIIKI